MPRPTRSRSPSSADTNDNVCDDDCSLREAVYEADFATGTDTISFASGLSGEITLDPLYGPLFVGLYGSVNVDGPGADVLSVSGDNQTAIFKIFGFLTPDRTTTISGLTLKEGDAVAGGTMGAGAINNYSVSSSFYDGNLAVADSVISDNSGYLGGGVANFGDRARGREPDRYEHRRDRERCPGFRWRHDLVRLWVTPPRRSCPTT